MLKRGGQHNVLSLLTNDKNTSFVVMFETTNILETGKECIYTFDTEIDKLK